MKFKFLISILLGVLCCQYLQAQSLTFYCGIPTTEPQEQCINIAWTANNANVSTSGNNATKINNTGNWNSGAYDNSNALANPGDSFSWSVSAIRQVVGLAYNPTGSTSWNNADFAVYSYANTGVRAYENTWAAPYTSGVNLTSGQRLRLLINTSNQIEFQIETTAGTGTYTTFYTSTNTVTAPLFPYATFGNNGADSNDAQKCTNTSNNSKLSTSRNLTNRAFLRQNESEEILKFYAYHNQLMIDDKRKINEVFFWLDLPKKELKNFPLEELNIFLISVGQTPGKNLNQATNQIIQLMLMQDE